MDLSAAQAAGLLIVDLDENALCLIHHCFGIGTVVCKGEIAVAVHGRNGNAECIVLVLNTDVAGNITVVSRQNVGIAGVDSLSCTAG